jgi:hypothetical protein
MTPDGSEFAPNANSGRSSRSGLTQSDLKTDITAVAPADDAGFAHAELVHEGDDIVGHQVVAKGAGMQVERPWPRLSMRITR